MNKRNGLLTGFKLPVDVEFCGVLNRKKKFAYWPSIAFYQAK